MLSRSILDFLKELAIDVRLPKGVDVLNPYQVNTTFEYAKQFYTKYYSDNEPRIVLLGINPGRLGAGLTGIPFTDPIKLHEACGIDNNLPKRPELSSDFIHQVIIAYGGLTKFYSRFYFSSVSPLGFTKAAKNLNYYDLPLLQKRLKPFIVNSLQKQLSWRLSKKTCLVLGEGKNFNYVQTLNTEYNFFKQVIPLAHPRFVMQYKRRQMNDYIDDYLSNLQSAEL